jgi:cytochrome bd-type quinol oxidase subunit 2
MAKNKKLFISLFCFTALILVLLVLGFFSQNRAQAQCDPASTTLCIPNGAQTGLPDPADPKNAVAGVLMNVLNWMLSILGVVGVLGFVISGFQYLTAYGNENQIESAKRTMTYSIIGIVVGVAGLVFVRTIDQLLR